MNLITKPVSLGPVKIGQSQFIVVGGPCSIDGEKTFLETAHFLKRVGAHGLRGAIYKMRTKPEAFQGLGLEGLPIIKRARTELGMPVFTEITDVRQIEHLVGAVDVFQVGARSMYNYELLKELGQQSKPVLLKRAFSATIDEWLSAADYVERGGKSRVVLCERGIRTFESKTRNTLDVGAVAYVKKHTHFPVMVDPSHAAGRSDLVEPLALASLAAGADGLIVEVHSDPDQALSDKEQALSLSEFSQLMIQLVNAAPVFGKELTQTPSFREREIHV